MPSEVPLPLRYRCPKTWSELEGEGARRHCASCELSVQNLSQMTERQARRFLADRLAGRLAGREERTCVAYLCTPGGEVVHRPTRWRRALALTTRAIAGAFALLVPLASGCRKDEAIPEASKSPKTTGSNASGSSADAAGAVDETATEKPVPDLELLQLMGYFTD